MEIIGNRYRIVGILGSGGGGVVYHCVDENNCYAIKKLHVEGSIALEIKALARLKHPNIVTLFDCFTEDNAGYLVMELIHGKHLRDYLNQKGEPGSDAREKAIWTVIPQILQALDYLHGRGVIHGDIKPHNILVDDQDNVHITDFGLARIGPPIQSHTEGNAFAGTVHYASPEQCRGAIPDLRSDLYSLGVVLYEAFSGTRPFSGSTFYEVIMKHVKERPPSLSLVSGSTGASEEKTIMWMLEKKPADRLPSAREVWRCISENNPVGSALSWAGNQEIFNPAFMGRDEELKFISECSENAVAHKKNRFIIVSGETGMGKTRLLKEFEILNSWQGNLIFGISLGISTDFSYEQLLSDLKERLDRMLNQMPEHQRKDILRGTGQAITSLKGWQEYKDEHILPVGLSEAIRILIQNIVGIMPVIIYIDDLHRMSSWQKSFIDEVVLAVGDGITIIFLKDDQELSPDSDYQHFFQSILESAEQITLKPLSDSQIKGIVSSMLGTLGVDDKFIRRTAEYSGGNPALAQEVVRNAIRSSALIYKNYNWTYWPDRWNYSQGTFRDLFISRIKSLPESSKFVLQTIAIIDPNQEMAAVCYVSGLELPEFLDALEDLEHFGLVERRSGKLHVRQRILLDLVLDTCNSQRMKTLHDRIARYYIENENEESEIARHLTLGNEPSEAVHYYLLAIQRRLSASRYSEVIQIAKAALKIAPLSNPKDLCSLYNNLGKAQRALGQLKEAQKTYTALTASAKDGLDREMELQALYGLAGILYSSGNTIEAQKRFQQALALCIETKNDKLDARCRLGLGVCCLSSGDFYEALKNAERAKEIFQYLKMPNSAARCYQLLGDVHFEMGLFPQSQACNEAAIKIFKAEEHIAHVAECMASIGRSYHEQGRLGEAELINKDALVMAEASKHLVLVNLIRINLGIILLDKGEPLKAIREIELAGSAVQEIGYPKTIADTYAYLAVAHECIGDTKGAERNFDSALLVYREQRDLFGETGCIISRGNAVLQRGKLDLALKHADSAIKIIHQIRSLRLAADYFELKGKIQAFHREKQSRRLFRASLKINNHLGRNHKAGIMLCELGFLALDQQDYLEARDYFDRAEKILENSGIITVVLRTLRGKYETALFLHRWEDLKRISDVMQELLGNIEDHTAIPHIFFRVDLPGQENPLRENGSRLAQQILRSKTFENTPTYIFALTAVAAGLASEEAEPFYRKAIVLAEKLNLQSVAHVLKEHFQETVQVKKRTNNSELDGRKEKMTITDMTPIRFLLRSSRKLFTAGDLNRLFTSILDQVIEVTGAERGFLMTCTQKSKLEFKISRNIRQEDISEPKFETSRTIIEHVFNTSKAYLSGDVGSDDAFREQRSIQMLGLRSILCIPIPGLEGREKPEGLIYVDNSLEKGLFNSTDKLLVEIVAELASLALNNVRSREELAASRQALSAENIKLKEELGHRYKLGSLIGRCHKMTQIFDLIQRVSDTNASILISGGTGTGKEIVAKTIHFNSSRKVNSFVGINCAALPESLLEAELFGIEKGVATGVDARLGLISKADKGTLFLDEIGDMSPSTQAKILRVLQEREVTPLGGRAPKKVDIRIISASNKDLKAEIFAGRFREDLYYRLKVIHLELPPLNQRKEDIPDLARYFLSKYSKENKRDIKDFKPEALSILINYSWPGNVRELENAVQRAVIMEPGKLITIGSFPEEILESQPEMVQTNDSLVPFIQGMDLKSNLERLEKHLLEEALKNTNGLKKEAAALLGISPRILSYYLKKHGMI